MTKQSSRQLGLRDFVVVAKPGIVLGNLMVGVGAFCFGAALVRFDWVAFFAFAVGMALVVAASCVLNNYYDQDIDRKMKRTSTRPSATGVLPLHVALPYAAVLYGVGFGLLGVYVNALTALIGLVGAVLYVVAYSFAKRHTHYATQLGTMPGATPPLAGYAAATGEIAAAGWLLFGLMVAWQMPHFYAIAIFRLRDYRAAGVPVLPAVKGLRRTVREIRLYGALFLLFALLFTFYSGASLFTGLALCALAIFWVSKMVVSPRADHETTWARGVFFASLWILPAMTILLVIDRWLPAL